MQTLPLSGRRSVKSGWAGVLVATFGTQSGCIRLHGLLCWELLAVLPGFSFLGVLTACISFLLVCDPSFLSGERDFPASCSLRGGTTLQVVCSSPKLTLFLLSFDIFHYFPTVLSIQTTICMILPLHPSNLPYSTFPLALEF